MKQLNLLIEQTIQEHFKKEYEPMYSNALEYIKKYGLHDFLSDVKDRVEQEIISTGDSNKNLSIAFDTLNEL